MPVATPKERGSSLIEATIAVALCAAVMAAACPVLLALVRASATVRAQTMTAALAASRLEQLRALHWYVSEDAAGFAVERIDTTTDLSTLVPSNGGPGLRPRDLLTLRANVAGYVDYLDRNGRWLGNGPSAPEGTRFVRRWAVAAAPFAVDGVLALHAVVFVWSPSAPPGIPREPQAALTWLSSARSREWR